MATARRYLTFSLRTLFLALTALAIWLGVVVHRAREQREAVKAIEALGGDVIYDWEDPFAEEPAGRAWLRRVVGDDFFQDAYVAILGEKPDIVKSIPHLTRLRRLHWVIVPYETATTSLAELKAALPHCKIREIVY